MRSLWLRIISSWNFLKVIRVVAALFILVSGITGYNVTFILLGSFFLLYALIIPGTCCVVYNPSSKEHEPGDQKKIEYEEMDAE